MKSIDKIRIEKIKTWNKNKQKKSKNTKTIKKGMETNETRKGKYSKIILREKKLQKRRNQIKSRK
jgi:hypothetical protein